MGASISFFNVLASIIVGPGISGTSPSVRKSCASVALLIGHRSPEVYVCLLREAHTVLFLVCPSLGFPPPRSSGHPEIIFGCEV